jgi:hypothetical protein
VDRALHGGCCQSQRRDNDQAAAASETSRKEEAMKYVGIVATEVLCKGSVAFNRRTAYKGPDDTENVVLANFVKEWFKGEVLEARTLQPRSWPPVVAHFQSGWYGAYEGDGWYQLMPCLDTAFLWTSEYESKLLAVPVPVPAPQAGRSHPSDRPARFLLEVEPSEGRTSCGFMEELASLGVEWREGALPATDQIGEAVAAWAEELSLLAGQPNLT